MWDSIKDNWAQLTVIGVALISLHLGTMWVMVGARVDTKLVDVGLVSPAVVAANTESIKDLEKESEKLDDKIERIVTILLEP